MINLDPLAEFLSLPAGLPVSNLEQNRELIALSFLAGWLGFLHTVLGPDHYVPFVALSRAANWTKLKTLVVTFLCGLGHVLSSLAVGLIGLALGFSLSSLELWEGQRGNAAAWLFIAFGALYSVWGLRHARRRAHTHEHRGSISAPHHHSPCHAPQGALTPWILFIIFVFGPCEVLIPVLLYPAATLGLAAALLVCSVFAASTILSMLALVFLGIAGLEILPSPRLEQYSHLLAGSAICLCGLSIKFIGL